MSMTTPMSATDAVGSVSPAGYDYGLCQTIGWPPTSQPSPPFIPNPPNPLDLIPCLDKWAYFWTNTKLGNFWMYIRKVVFGLPHTVVGCVLLPSQSGHLRYYMIEVELRYITSHICSHQG
ncbi:hypothetical protein [Paenibacillus sp. 481]|uniref:hypothetical protein n=1 Tax=Paenibacillus sp. 481 TaxID=2835869 RepID=UPI001E453600|nr:hypothetical protein [Paenibacillus sp. 481]UHA74691.1 hypothetical protein KIK04_06345 [Paenibacillus sp. 481]